jgi:hypothetical protein
MAVEPALGRLDELRAPSGGDERSVHAAREPRPPAKFTTPASPSKGMEDAATEAKPPADCPASSTCRVSAQRSPRTASTAARRSSADSSPAW